MSYGGIPKNYNVQMQDDEEDFFAFSIPNEYIIDEKYYWMKEECDHKWKSYTGLRESFEYCEKCDIKKEDDE